MSWIVLAVLAFTPACLATYYTKTTINIHEGIKFHPNVTTGHIIIDSVDHRDWIFCDSIYGGVISARIGNVTSYYDLSEPFVYRQNKPFIEVEYNRIMFDSSDPVQKSRNAWFRVDTSRFLFPYGEPDTDSPIEVVLRKDLLKLRTSMAHIEVVRQSEAFAQWRWEGIHDFRLLMMDNTVMVKYSRENRMFMSPGALMDYSADWNTVKIWTSNSGTYEADLVMRSVKYTAQGGRVYKLSTSSNNGASKFSFLKSDNYTIVVSSKESTEITHYILGNAVYRATLTDYLGGSLNQTYYYNLQNGMVQLNIRNKTVITVNMRDETVQGRGRFENRATGWLKEPEKVWYSEDFGTQVAFYRYHGIKIDGPWKVEIDGYSVKTEHGTTTWTLSLGRLHEINYEMNDGEDMIRARTREDAICINEFYYSASGDHILSKSNTFFFLQALNED